jgi:predicted RecB family nuclease
MLVTQEIFEAFVKCPTKSLLSSNGAQGIESEFGEWQRHIQEEYNEAASQHLRSSLRANEWCIGTPPAEQFNQRRNRLILNYAVADPEIQTRLHGLELDHSPARGGRHSYIPIRFVAKEKLAASDRLLLAFDAFALSRVIGKVPSVGKIIHGCRFSTVKVPLTKLFKRVRAALDSMASERATSAVSAVVLNRHCPECEFQARCRGIAREKDDLSLLSKLSDKERKKYHDKGIFTVTQLSYTFRPRKRSGCSTTKHYLR